MMAFGPDVSNNTTSFIFRYVSTINSPVQKVTGLPFLLGSNATFQLSILSNDPKQLFPIKTLSNMFGWVYLVTWALYTSPSTPSVGKARPNVSRLVVAKRSK